jgi:hypothetical protein
MITYRCLKLLKVDHPVPALRAEAAEAAEIAAAELLQRE